MVYLHIPFCRSFCTYCGFYSELLPGGAACRNIRNPETVSAFADAVCREAADRKAECSGGPDTLYIGGGTPSVLPFSLLERIVRTLSEEFRWNGLEEFTVEVNPEDIAAGGKKYVEDLRRIGVDRVSMGVQSFDDGVLKWMNRRHDAATALEACRILRSAGVENMGVDLIFGLSFMDEKMWNATIWQVLNLPGGPPEHISAYQLSVEDGSALEKLIRKGKYREGSDEVCAHQYEILCRALGTAGYHHYEVSNFALPGREAVHNSAYWSGKPYVGLGPGAHSLSVSGERRVRSWAKPSLQEYIAAYSAGGAKDIRESEVLTEVQMAMEKIMLSLRTDAGMPETELRRLGSPDGTDRMLASGDLKRIQGGRIRIPEDRFFISDAIIPALVR